MASDDMDSLGCNRRQIVGSTSACEGSECPNCLLINLLPVSHGVGIQMSSFRSKTGMVNNVSSQDHRLHNAWAPLLVVGALRVARTIIAKHSYLCSKQSMSASTPDNLPNALVSLSREGNVEVYKVEAKGLLHVLQWFVLFSSIIYWFCPLPPCSPQLGRKQTEAGRYRRDGPLRHSGVGDHAAGTHDLGQVAARHHSGFLLASIYVDPE